MNTILFGNGLNLLNGTTSWDKLVHVDVIYNRATTCEKAYYFKDANELLSPLTQTELDGKLLKEKEIAQENILGEK